ncbi:MAG: OmpA family protein [Thermodesulfobacteriota bacterium]
MNRPCMDHFFLLKVFFGVLLILWIANTGMATTPLSRETLFASVEEKMKSALKAKADIYSPASFAAGMECYNDAKASYDNGDDISEIRQQVNDSISNFEKALQHVSLAADFFSAIIKAREDCLKVNGPTYEIEKWKEAEDLFHEAAAELEDDNMEKAKETAAESEKIYREIELFSIQSQYLQNVWLLLDKADDMGVKSYAPLTYEKARKLAMKSESLFRANRYDQTEAPQIADQAAYETNHAIYLYQAIKQMDDTDQSIESIMLNLEDSLRKIGLELDIDPKFDQGMEISVNNIINNIKKLKNNQLMMSQQLKEYRNEYFNKLAQKDTEIYNAQNQLMKINEELNQLSNTKNKLQSKVEQEKIRKNKINRIGLLYSPAEAKVLLDGENIIIRLHGLSFPIGKATIEPKYVNLLNRTISAINEFPGCRIVFEGHTDSRGSDKTNQTLSEERAKAVSEYIISNSTISPTRIEVIGYGEARPIASNENEEGQAINRRIDVVIQP